MLSLVHMMRENTEKLERHEARERQLGEQMKKSVALLTKKITTVEGFKPHLVKLDERVAGIEQLIAQVLFFKTIIVSFLLEFRSPGFFLGKGSRETDDGRSIREKGNSGEGSEGKKNRKSEVRRGKGRQGK